METETDYKKQAEDFLKSTDTTFKAEFVKHGKHFDDDKESRDIYKITLKRGSREFVFNFGQSIANSGKYTLYSDKKYIMNEKPKGFSKGQYKENKEFSEPTSYDVLACLTKYDVGTFEDFCHEFGYEYDSRKAEKTYKAVLNEWQNVKMLWADAEIERLQEVQ